MPKFEVIVDVESQFYEIEAENEAEAERIALENFNKEFKNSPMSWVGETRVLED